MDIKGASGLTYVETWSEDPSEEVNESEEVRCNKGIATGYISFKNILHTIYITFNYFSNLRSLAAA